MKLIAPTTFVAATHLVSSNATEPYATWASGTTYAKDAFVDYGTHIYQSLVNSNTGNQPDTSPTQWVLVGPDNTHAMFDDQISTATNSTSPLTVVLATGLANSMAMFGLVGTRYRSPSPMAPPAPRSTAAPSAWTARSSTTGTNTSSSPTCRLKKWC
jgi:hypothetical protein